MTCHVIRGAGDCIMVGSLPVWSWASCWYSLGFLVINNIPVVKRLEELRPRSVSWTWPPHTVVFWCVWFYKDVIREPTTVTLQWWRAPSFLGCPLLEAAAHWKWCAFYDLTQWNEAVEEELLAHTSSSVPTPPLQLAYQILKDILAYFGIFASFFFPRTLKIQNERTALTHGRWLIFLRNFSIRNVSACAGLCNKGSLSMHWLDTQ